MSMNPIGTKAKIEKEYKSYLQSILTVQDNTLNERAKKSLDSGVFVKGPYLEATLPFHSGMSLKQLAEEGIASNEFGTIQEDVHFERLLYAHQEKAFRKITCDERNVIVATGTGSGKTECYLYPIFDYLMKEKEKGSLDPGVRALLLFPMNALANDQVKKLRLLLKNYPDITFGRYTGETPDGNEEMIRKEYRTDTGEEPLPNEMLTRGRMQETPPHILLTNYAMLEYLLLRPADSELFDGVNAKSWKFIVIDEAHTYRGTNGTEIAFLLRRLKERIRKHNQTKLQCIATSATLGDENAMDSITAFAENLFDEPFYKEDIVSADRIYRKKNDMMKSFFPEDYEALRKNAELLDDTQKGTYFYEHLINDSRIIDLQEIIQNKPAKAEEIADAVFTDIPEKTRRLQAFVSLVDLAVRAKEDADSNALLPARYHLFVKSLEGMFISLYPRKEVYLDRKASIYNDAGKVAVFELVNCQYCKKEYLVGRITGEKKLELPLDNEPPEYFLMEQNDGVYGLDFDEDDTEEQSLSTIHNLEKMILCTVCGKIHPADEHHGLCCEVNDSGKYITVYRLKKDERKSGIDSCISCGAAKKNILKRFFTSNHAATFAVANSLYEAIPPKDAVSQQLLSPMKIDDEDFFNEIFGEDDLGDGMEIISSEKGRKLLIFSDNRQEAAYFAGYLSKKHSEIMWRRLILAELKKEKEGICIGNLIDILRIKAEKAELFENYNLTDIEKKNIAAQYVLKEFMEMEKLTGLSGRGFIEFYPEKILMKRGVQHLNAEETWNLLRFVMETLKNSGAVQYPDYLPYTDEFFLPRNFEIGFRRTGGNSHVKGFIPSVGRKNKRSAFFSKIFGEQGPAQLETFFELLIKLGQKGYLVKKSLDGFRNEGEVYSINPNKWKVRYINENEILYKCNKCGKIATYHINHQCPEFKCDGTLEEVEAGQVQKIPYYYDLYKDEKIIPMVAKEHTAQLSRKAAGDYQEKFEKGKINVLSCSTTFEMGVDVGELEATFLRNVPPETANYIQRAGRAGRRTSSTAFAVTFARRNSHDINFFNKPEEIISGKIRAPYIEVENDKVAVRHVNSIVLAWFFSKRPEYFGKVEQMLGGNGLLQMDVSLREMLLEKPTDLRESVEDVLGKNLCIKLDIEHWNFMDRLVGEDGTLTVALSRRREEVEQLRNIILQRVSENKTNSIGSIDKLKKTLLEEPCISFLASNGVLPKYGFPVDVVDLTIMNNSIEAKNIMLSRDLKMAISEFAPPSELVANSKIWRSHSINTVATKGWPERFYYECKNCQRIAPPDDNYIGCDDEELRGIVKECQCGGVMKLYKFIIPIFGFSTSMSEKPRKVGEEKPKRYYSTRTQFWGVDKLDSYQQEQRIETAVIIRNRVLPVVYTPNGKLVVINKGRSGRGLFICKACGYVAEVPQKTPHKTRLGYDCGNKLSNLSLGHEFNSDILRIELPLYLGAYDMPIQWTSVLYSILEGASLYLGIDRNDINGCLDYEHGNFALILYDESPGGAGHVKRIATNLEAVLHQALERVNGSCGCSEDTSCYGCLRNYGNQFEHERIIRGAARDYLRWLLFD